MERALEWHREAKAAVIAALAGLGIEGSDGAGVTPNGTKWKADVLFSVNGRNIAIVLQRGYQPLREFRRRQLRFAECQIDCFWLFQRETFAMLTANIAHARKTSALPELPSAMWEEQRVEFGDAKRATMNEWLAGVLDGSFRYRDGWWTL